MLGSRYVYRPSLTCHIPHLWVQNLADVVAGYVYVHEERIDLM